MSSDDSLLLVALDVDRTVFDTSRFVELLYDRLLDHGIKQSTIDTMRGKEMLLRGSNFDIVSSLATQNVLPAIEELYPYVSEIVYEGVPELINNLIHSKIPFLFLTYGSDIAQRYKISLIEYALGRVVPFHITNEPDKSGWLERVESNEGFVIALDDINRKLVAKSIILVDDKPSNLHTSHPHIHTILIDNTSSSDLAGAGISIDNVWDAIQSYI